MTSIQFPGWFYSPDGQSQIFESIEEVPQGWEDHPSKLATLPQGAKATTPLTKAEVIKELNTKPITQLWSLAKKIEVAKAGANCPRI